MSLNEMPEENAEMIEDLSDLDEEMKELIASENFRDAQEDAFKEETIQSKEELLDRMKKTRESFRQEAMSEKKKHSPAFYAVLDSLYEKALQELNQMELPEPLQKWWYFLYEITPSGLTVKLNHIRWSGFSCNRSESFVLLSVPTRMLTVTEYAQRYEVGPTTVRSWIRRAKIRSAVKYGSEWRIPELAEVIEGEHYSAYQYEWSSTLTDVPKKYAFLNEFVGIDLYRDFSTTGRYLAKPRLQEDIRYSHSLDLPEFVQKRCKILSKYPDLSLTEDGLLVMDAKTRAALELYLISSPLIAFRKGGDFRLNYLILEEGGEFCEGANLYNEDVEYWLD